MDKIVALIVEKTGISEEKATMAAETVLGYVKEKLPAGLGSQIDSFIGGEDSAEEGGEPGGGIADKLGGMFGG